MISLTSVISASFFHLYSNCFLIRCNSFLSKRITLMYLLMLQMSVLIYHLLKCLRKCCLETVQMVLMHLVHFTLLML